MIIENFHQSKKQKLSSNGLQMVIRLTNRPISNKTIPAIY